MKSEKIDWGALAFKTKAGEIRMPTAVETTETVLKDGTTKQTERTVSLLRKSFEIMKPENAEEIVAACGGSLEEALAVFFYGLKLQWQGWARNVAQGAIVDFIGDSKIPDDAAQYAEFSTMACEAASEAISAQLAEGYGPFNLKPSEKASGNSAAVRLSAKLQGAVKNAVGAGLDDAVIHAILDSEFTADKVSAAIAAARG